MKTLILAALFTGAAAYGVVSFQGEPYKPPGVVSLHEQSPTGGRSIEERKALIRNACERLCSALDKHEKRVTRTAQGVFLVANPNPNDFLPEIGLALESLRVGLTNQGSVTVPFRPLPPEGVTPWWGQ